MKKENGFLRGAAILSMAGVIVKILGAMYRIPLSNIIKSEGMGYYQTAYPFYVLLLTISTAGFPVAIAKLVSERRSLEDYRSAEKIFRVSMVILSVFGVLSSAYLYLNAARIVENIQNPNAYYALVALSPALIFVPIMSVFRGYFQGMQDMVPTAISQIFEQLFRVIGGLSLTYLLLGKGIKEAAGGASLGGTLGALAGTIAMLAIYFKKRPGLKAEINSTSKTREYKTSQIVKDLLIIAIPITIGAAIIPIMDYIDLKIVLKRLQEIGFSEASANELYGNLKGMAQTLINLPQVFAVAISVSLVPAIANAKIKEDKEEVKKIISSGIRVTLLIGLPSAIGLFVMGKPIIELLYYKNTPETILITGRLLQTLSMGVIFLTLVQSLAAILQGLGRPLVPAINLFIGAIAKAVLTYSLSGVKAINIYGAAISTVVAFFIACVLDLIAVSKYADVDLDLDYIFKKPIISAVGMGIVVKISHLLLSLISTSKIITLLAILIGGISYIVLLFKTGTFTDEDLKLIPKGDKIISVVNKFKRD